MSERQKWSENKNGVGLYEIRLKGHLNKRWAGQFGEVSLTLEDDGNTLLVCPVADQAALYGLLKKVRDLGITLVSVEAFELGDR